MNSLRSPALLRLMLCDTTAEFQALNSTTFPDGALVYNNQTDSLYRLNKDAGTTFDTLIPSGIVVKPNDGTAARWIAQSVSGSNPYYYETYLSGNATVGIAGANTWALLGNQAATFLRANGSALLYTLNPTTGLVTYNGPPIQAIVRATASVLSASGAAGTIAAAISSGNDIPSGATGDKASFGMQVGDAAEDSLVCIPTSRVVSLSPGSTLQLAFRNSSPDNLTVVTYQLIVDPL